MKRCKKDIVTICITVCILMGTLSGCSQIKPLNRTHIIQCIAVDAAQHGAYKLTVQNYKPGNAESADQQHELHITYGDSVCDALDQITEITGDDLMFADAKIVILSQEIINRGLYQVLDYFIRERRISPDIVLLCTQGNAGDILSTESDERQMTSQYIYDIVQSDQSGQNSLSGELIDVGGRLFSDSCDAYMPMIEKYSDESGENLRLCGIVCFEGDIPVCTLKDSDADAFMWINGLANTETISLEYKEALFSFKILQTKRKMSVDISDSKPLFHLDLDATVELREISGKGQRNFSDYDIESVKGYLCRTLEGYLYSSVNKAITKNNSDVFRFGCALKKYQPEYFKAQTDIRNYMQTAQYDLTVTATVKRTGIENDEQW